jgi:hypothetical protein
MNKWIWGFVVSVACLDIGFSYNCQDSMLDWESNPVARWTFQSGGITGVVAFRALILLFAVGMSCTTTRWSRLVAPIWGAGHAYLLMTLLMAGPYIGTLRTASTFQLPVMLETARPNGHRFITQPQAVALCLQAKS